MNSEKFSNGGEITPEMAQMMKSTFDNDENLSVYQTSQAVTEKDLQPYINNSENLIVCFGDDSGKLYFDFSASNPDFENSPIKTVFDNYSKKFEDQQYLCPSAIGNSV